MALKKVREIARSADNQLGDIELLYLARIFGVSFLAAARRCEDLSLLPRGGAASLNEALLKNFGSAEKRADQLKLPPRPKIEFHPVPQALLASAVDRIRAGELSIGGVEHSRPIHRRFTCGECSDSPLKKIFDASALFNLVNGGVLYTVTELLTPTACLASVKKECLSIAAVLDAVIASVVLRSSTIAHCLHQSSSACYKTINSATVKQNVSPLPQRDHSLYAAMIVAHET